MKNKIYIKDLSVSFDKSSVLSDVNMEISENTAIMGASGRGKTTLLRTVMGLVDTYGGEISFENKPKISAVFQEDRLFDSFSAVENITAVCSEKMKREQKKSLAESLLDELLISREEQNKTVCDFSGGMRRRVAIARALACDFDILLLDEPYKGLDENTKRVCAECIKAHTEDKLVILVTHDTKEIELTGIDNTVTL